MKRAAGMTLLEVSIALALFSLLAVGLLTAFRMGQRSLAQVKRVTDQSRELLTTNRVLHALIESAAVADAGVGGLSAREGLSGSVDDLNLTAPAPMGVGGLYRYQFALRNRAGGTRDLVIHARDDVGEGGSGQVPADTTEVLVAVVQRVRWSYRAAPVRQPSGQFVDSPWQSLWTDSRHPPALVALDIVFPEGDARRWPQLIVATRATDAGACVFDVVAQACREPGT